jgi:acetyl-CoA C-acetyltransferase
MDDVTTFPATIRAAREAYAMAGLTAGDIDVAEVHDCFTTAEIVATEDLGFFPRGTGGAAVEEGWTAPDGKVAVNPSGGLIAKGHPVGATGCAQIYELVRQLRGEAANQVRPCELALAHNLGGTGVVSTVTILGHL